MHSPRKPLSIPKQATGKIVEPLTVEQQSKIEDACSEDEYGLLFLFLLYSGLRRSEICALKWEDYDISNQQIRIRKKTGINDFTNHVCRHSFATRMLESEADTKAIADILGHASVSFTLDRYVKSQPEYLRKQINLLGNPKLLRSSNNY